MESITSFRKIGPSFLVACTVLLLAWWRVNAQTPSPEQLAEGARLYAENCAVCHGAEGEGRVGATLAKDWPSIRPDATVRNVIANGVPQSPMQPWSQEKGGPLTASEIDSLTGFILSWGSSGFPDIPDFPTPTAIPPITPLAEVQGDPNRGAVLYVENCAMCHGAQGEGRVGATLAKDWPSIRPDLTIKNVIANGVPNTPMLAWSNGTGGPLSDEEINDIVAYVMALPSLNPPGGVSDVGAPTEEPKAPAWVQGVIGVALFLVVLIVVVGGVLLFQKRT